MDPRGAGDHLERAAGALPALATMDSVAATDLASLRGGLDGRHGLPEAIRRRSRRFGHAVLATYGLTEAPTVGSIDPVGGPHVAGASGGRSRTSR